MRLKPSKSELGELAEQAIKALEQEIKELNDFIELSQAKIEDKERKIRWLRREILG